MSPQRIQLRRTKGWRKPEGAVVVSRPSKWGNPFRAAEYAADYPDASAAEIARMATSDFRGLVDGRWPDEYDYPTADIIELAGRDLACWCPPDQPCHADVLLELANAQARPVPLPGRSPDPAHRSGEQHRNQGEAT